MKIMGFIFSLFLTTRVMANHHLGCVEQIKKDIVSVQREAKKLHKVRFISNFLNKKEIEKLKSKEKLYSGLLKGKEDSLKRASQLMCGIFKYKIVGEGNYNFTLGNRKGDCEKLALGLKLMCKYNKEAHTYDNFIEYSLSEYYFCCQTKSGRKDSRCTKRWPKCG